MRKYDNKFTQYDPALYVNGEQIPTVTSGESFVYLGKIFSFEMKNEDAKIKTSKKLTSDHPPEHNKQPEGQTTMETGDSAAFRSHSAFVRTAFVWFRSHVGGTKSRLNLLPPRQRLDQPSRV